MIPCSTLIEYHNIDAFENCFSHRIWLYLYEDYCRKVFIIRPGHNSDSLDEINNTLQTKYNFECHIENGQIIIESYSNMKNLLTLLKIQETN